jgi:restriction endonuclease S subunit
MSELKTLPMREKWVGYRKPNLGLIPPDWTMARIRDVATFKGGGSLGLTMADYKSAGTPAYTAEGQNGFAAETEFDTKAVIVSSIGALCGKSFYNDGPFTTLANVQVIFGDEEKICNYFLWNLLNDRAYWAPYQTAQPFIRPSDIQKSWIPLPATREEQGRIADTLKAANDHVRALEDQIRKAERIKKALLQSFPSPPKFGLGTPLFQVADIDSGFTQGRDLAGHATVEVAYLTVVNVLEGRVDMSNLSTARVKLHEVEHFGLREGDILMTEGGDRDKVGRGSIWLGQIPRIVCQNHIFRVRLNTERFLPWFMHYFLQTYSAKRYFTSRAKQSSNLCSINSREMRRFELPTLSIKEQKPWVERLRAADSVITAIELQHMAAQRVKQSLLQNLLTGKIRLKA